MSPSHAGSISFALPSIDKSPQLELFGVTGKDTYSVLAPHLWHLQKAVLARCSGFVKQRQAAAEADAERLRAEFYPLETNYSWRWPNYGYLYEEVTELSVPRGPRLPYLPQSNQPNADLQAVFNQVSRHIAMALSRPCTVLANDYQTRVEFLDSIAWVASRARRCIFLEVRDVNGDWQMSAEAFDFSRPLHKPFWLDQAMLPWISRIDQVFGERAVDAHWRLRKNLEHRFHNTEILAAVAQQVKFHLAAAPAFIGVLRKLLGVGSYLDSTNESFNEYWQDEMSWVAMVNHYPRLVHLYCEARGQGLLPAGSGVVELRRLCRGLGLSRAGWRFLSRYGEEAYEFAYFCTRDGRWRLPQVVNLVEWQSRTGLGKPMAWEALYDLDVAGCIRADETGRYRIDVDPRIARVHQDYRATLDEPEDPEAVDYAVRTVFRWVRDHQPDFDRNQWKSGWPAIKRACEKWLRERPDFYCWSPLLESFEIDRWSVKPLVGSNQLALEGVRMKHCVEMYTERCLDGEYKVFAVEDTKSGQAVATLGLEWKDDKWVLEQARGKLNREVREELEPVVHAILGKANALPAGETGGTQQAA